MPHALPASAAALAALARHAPLELAAAPGGGGGGGGGGAAICAAVA